MRERAGERGTNTRAMRDMTTCHGGTVTAVCVRQSMRVCVRASAHPCVRVSISVRVSVTVCVHTVHTDTRNSDIR